MSLAEYRKNLEESRPDCIGLCDDCLRFMQGPGNFRCESRRLTGKCLIATSSDLDDDSE